MSPESLDPYALESRWQANERELRCIAAMPGLDREMHAADSERLEAEQVRIEWQLGLSALPMPRTLTRTSVAEPRQLAAMMGPGWRSLIPGAILLCPPISDGLRWCALPSRYANWRDSYFEATLIGIRPLNQVSDIDVSGIGVHNTLTMPDVPLAIKTEVAISIDGFHIGESR